MPWIGRISIVVLLGVAASLALGSAAYEASDHAASAEPQLHLTTASPDSAAAAYAVFDAETGTVLYTKNADDVRPIASITKLFAAAAIIDTFDLEQSTTLSWADLQSHGTAGALEPQQTYTYRELLFPLLLSSSNNASLTFSRRSEHNGYSLTSRAESIARAGGPSSIRLADTSGLSSDNISSATDLARATYQLQQSHPYVLSISGLSSYVGTHQGWLNNSPFIDDETFLGGKHGYTEAAGRTAVALFTETLDGEERAIGYVVLGSSDLARDVAELRTHVQHSVVWR